MSLQSERGQLLEPVRRDPLLMPLVFISLGMLIFLAFYVKVETWQLLVAVEGGFVVAAFVRGPLWALGGWLFAEFTMANTLLPLEIFPISGRLVLAIMTLLLVAPFFLKRQAFGRRGLGLLTLSGIFVATTVASNVVNTNPDFVFKDFRFMFTFLLIAAAIPAVIRTKKDLVSLCGVVLAAVALSAVVGIMQHYNIMGLHGFGSRAIGLSDMDVLFSAQLVVVFPFIIAILALKRLSSPTLTLFLIASAGLVCLGVYFSYTRIAMVSLFVSMLVMLMLLKGTPRNVLLLVMLIVVMVFFTQGIMSGNRYSLLVSGEDTSFSNRQVLWQTAYNIALDHPFLGIGGETFEEEMLRYKDTVSPELLSQPKVGGVLGRYGPHNDFLKVWALYGTFALMFYLVILGMTFTNFLGAYFRTGDSLVRALALGGMASMSGYLLISFFQSMLLANLIPAILVGFSIALTKFSAPGELKSEP